MEYPQYGQPSQPTNQMAIISLISAIVAWVGGFLGGCVLSVIGLGFCVFPIFVIGNIVATVTGHMAQKQIADSGGVQGGHGLAITGLVLGWIGNGLTILSIVAICVIVVLALLSPGVGNVFSNIIENI